MADMYDNETGNVYKALSCCNNPDIAERCMVKDAPKVIWSVMGSPEFNSNCALGLREAFRKNQLRLLAAESDMEEYISELKGYQNLSLEEQLKIKLPYIHTSLLVNELINLEYEAKNSVIRVKEKTGMRKDRYSSLSYNIYVANQIMRDVQVAKAKKNVKELVFEFRAPVLRKTN